MMFDRISAPVPIGAVSLTPLRASMRAQCRFFSRSSISASRLFVTNMTMIGRGDCCFAYLRFQTFFRVFHAVDVVVSA